MTWASVSSGSEVGRVLHVEVRWIRVEEVRWGRLWYVKSNEPGCRKTVRRIRVWDVEVR